MALSRIESDLYVNGNMSAKTMTLATGSVVDGSVAAAAAIDATKLQHQHRLTYAQPNATATTETKAMYRCYGATGTSVDFSVGSIAVAVGAATVTFDLKKNGSSVLSGVITLNSSSVARVAQTGTISTPTLATGDLLEVVVVATAGGGTLPTGVFAVLTVNEKAI